MMRLLSLLVALPTLAFCAQTLSLDGRDWTIAADARNVGWKDGWYREPRPEAARTRVPWTMQDALPGYHGVAWYWREFAAPPNAHIKGRYLLRFNAVNYKGDVWVN